MPDMDEGAFVLDYNMPVGTSLAQTDKVMRRVEAVLLRTPDIAGYIRRTGAELGFFATEPYTGDILVSLKPTGQRRPMSEIVRRAPRGAQGRGPGAGDGVRPAGPGPDQRPGRRRAARSRSRSSVPNSSTLRELAEQVGKVVEKIPGVVDVNTHVFLGNPDIVVRARQHPDRSRRPHGAGRREPAQRRALWPGGQHGPRAGPDDQDSGPLPRPRPIRPRAPGPAADQPGDRHTSDQRVRPRRPAGIGFVPLGQLASIHVVRSPNELWRENQQPVITVTAELDNRDLRARSTAT